MVTFYNFIFQKGRIILKGGKRMKSSKLKLMLAMAVLFITIMISTSVLATNEGVQILEKSEKEYIIYLANHLDTAFEFAYSNDKDAVKEELTYKASATDTQQEDQNYIAYVDSQIYDTYFGKTAYLWARTLDGEYFAEGVAIDLTQAVDDAEVELANNITKIIEVNTQNTVTTEEMINDVRTTITVGKVDVLEEGITYYQLIKAESSQAYKDFMKIAKQIDENRIDNNMYAKLEVASQFVALYNQLVPQVKDSQWMAVENNVILQPEDADDDEEYVLWLKTENGEETKIDAQFLTCFRDEKREVISEKVVTKLPVTADDPTLFIILGVLVVALVVVSILRLRAKKDTTGKRRASKH